MCDCPFKDHTPDDFISEDDRGELTESNCTHEDDIERLYNEVEAHINSFISVYSYLNTLEEELEVHKKRIEQLEKGSKHKRRSL